MSETQEKVYAPCAGVLMNNQQVQDANPSQSQKPSRKPWHRESRQPSNQRQIPKSSDKTEQGPCADISGTKQW